MTLLLLVLLFIVCLLLSIRTSETVLRYVVAGVIVALASTLAALAIGAGNLKTDGLNVLNRTQGILVISAFILGTTFFSLGKVLAVSLDRPARLKDNKNKDNKNKDSKNNDKTVQPRPVRSAPQAPRRPNNSQSANDLRFQDYEVMDRIGIGGMGSVYRAKRKQDGRIVALKVPQEKYLADAKFVKRFYREAEVLKRFNHPNIVRVYDYRMQAPEHYIAMEFLDGESLESLLEDRSLTFNESTQVIRALADGLRHIHMQNVVHRDIKPANVMILKNAFPDGQLREGGVKLMDFGIAVGKILTRLTMTGARVGTPIYMAPEQAKGNRVDARSDVYSLGLLSYEMITGQTAFKGSYEAVVHQQVFEAPKPPKQIKLEVPGKLNDLILNMIEKDPAQQPTLDDIISRIDMGVLSDEIFDDPIAIAMSVQEKRGTLRLLDLKGKLRVSLRDQAGSNSSMPTTPNAIAGDDNGNLYITMLEYKQGKSGALIRKLDPEGRELLAFGTYGLSEGELLQPISITVTQGHVYVLDAEAFQVVVYDTQGQFIRRFGGRGSGLGRFEKPRSIAAAPDGHVYVLDSGTNEVQRFTLKGEYISRYAFRLDRNSDALRTLEGLGVDRFGAIYIVDGIARKLRKIEPDGTPGVTFTLETLVGEPNEAPWLLNIGPEGQIYAVRQGGQVLRTFSSVGDMLSSNDMYAPVQAMTMLSRPHGNAAPQSVGNVKLDQIITT